MVARRLINSCRLQQICRKVGRSMRIRLIGRPILSRLMLNLSWLTALQSVVEGVVVVEVADLVEFEVDVWVEVMMENWLIDDPVCFGSTIG